MIKSSKEEIPDISLLKALEQQKLSDFDEAVLALNDYIKKVPFHDRHPLYFIAKARQMLYKDKTSKEGIESLEKFANLYPNYVDNWFTEKEKKLLDDDDDNDDGKEILDVNNPLNKWEAFKNKENVECEQMDELMKLTGLRKVKKAAFYIFKSSLKFSRLSPELQAANPKSLNFCFLGNAVRKCD